MSHSEADFDPKPHRPSSGGLILGAVVVVAIFGALAAIGIAPRLTTKAQAERQKQQNAAVPAQVSVVRITRDNHGDTVPLPGSIDPLQETVVYARTNGYVKRYFVDIGDKVTNDQPLAELDTPDIDQELRQAEAMRQQSVALVQQSQTQLELARVTANRYLALSPNGVVSQQQLEERQSALQAQQASVLAAEASLNAAEANLHRLNELKSFATVHAPFAGVVTSRTMETGQLVVAGTGAGQPICRVMRTDTVRVFINVPQLYASAIRVGSDAPTRVREFSGRVFAGKVTRTSSALDPVARTLLVEVRIDNADGALLPGMYSTVSLQVQRANTPLLVPSTAVLVHADGLRLAVVENGHVHWRQVEVDADLGALMAIATGVHEGDAVVTTPSDRLAEGTPVIAHEEPKT